MQNIQDQVQSDDDKSEVDKSAQSKREDSHRPKRMIRAASFNITIDVN